jgi:hypothetical protein
LSYRLKLSRRVNRITVKVKVSALVIAQSPVYSCEKDRGPHTC